MTTHIYSGAFSITPLNGNDASTNTTMQESQEKPTDTWNYHLEGIIFLQHVDNDIRLKCIDYMTDDTTEKTIVTKTLNITLADLDIDETKHCFDEDCIIYVMPFGFNVFYSDNQYPPFSYAIQHINRHGRLSGVINFYCSGPLVIEVNQYKPNQVSHELQLKSWFSQSNLGNVVFSDRTDSKILKYFRDVTLDNTDLMTTLVWHDTTTNRFYDYNGYTRGIKWIQGTVKFNVDEHRTVVMSGKWDGFAFLSGLITLQHETPTDKTLKQFVNFNPLPIEGSQSHPDNGVRLDIISEAHLWDGLWKVDV
jgi:hypothetical protein